MPLMMDEQMDVDIDDLFGDEPGLALPSRPIPKELYQRLDELRKSACCHRLAWSKLGSIVSTTPDNTGLELSYLKCSSRDGTWALSPPTSTSFAFQDGPETVIQHVCWSSTGSDLAVIDTAGRVSMFAISMSLNKPTLSKNGRSDPLDDLSMVVGAYWLNTMPLLQRPQFVHRLAVKTEASYRYEASSPLAHGPCYPNPQKSALVYLTANGMLKLIYPQPDGKWQETSTEIESIATSDDLITHAAICADKKNTLLLTYATTTRHLYLFRIGINWGNRQPDRTTNLAQMMVAPVLQVKHIAVTNWMDSMEGLNPSPLQTSMVSLSHLAFLPPAPDGPGGQPTLPTIITVRSFAPTLTSPFSTDAQSVVDRWEVCDLNQTIHPAFEQMHAGKSQGTAPGVATSLRKADGFLTNKIVVSVEPIMVDRTLCFTYSDGTVEFRDRSSMSELFMDGDYKSFSHLCQTGFTLDDDETCLQSALSPTTCSMVKLNGNEKMRWKSITYQMGTLSSPIEDAQYGAIIAGMSMAAANAIMGSLNHDDLIAIAYNSISLSTFLSDWLLEICKVLKFVVDYSEEAHHDTLMRNPSVQLCFGLQNSLGYQGDLTTRSFGGKFAWLGLQTRNCVILFTMAGVKIQDAETQRKLTGVEDAEVVRILSGSIRWCLDLMSYLVDNLLHPSMKGIFKQIEQSNPSTDDLVRLNEDVQSSKNIALHLIFASATRGFLTAICRRLIHLDWTARKAMQMAAQAQLQQQQQTQIQQPIPTALRTAYTEIATLTSNASVNIRTFEAFLTSLNASIKESYTSAGLSSVSTQTQQGSNNNSSSATPAEKARNGLEQTMLFGGSLPEQLLPTLSHLFTSLLPSLRQNIDPSKLFFHDFSFLGLDPEEAQREHGRGKIVTVDVFLRTPIDLKQGMVRGGDGKVVEAQHRRCVRCAAVMGELHSRRTAVNWLIMQQRKCFCGGNWVLLGKDDK